MKGVNELVGERSWKKIRRRRGRRRKRRGVCVNTLQRPGLEDSLSECFVEREREEEERAIWQWSRATLHFSQELLGVPCLTNSTGREVHYLVAVIRDSLKQLNLNTHHTHTHMLGRIEWFSGTGMWQVKGLPLHSVSNPFLTGGGPGLPHPIYLKEVMMSQGSIMYPWQAFT